MKTTLWQVTGLNGKPGKGVAGSMWFLKLRYFDVAASISMNSAPKGHNIPARGKRSGDRREVPPRVTEMISFLKP